MKLINKANREKRWRAKNNEIYYFINYCNQIESWSESNHNADEALFEVGNYFKTAEEAEFELNKRLIYQELKDYALEHNEMSFDWTDNHIKWVVYYNAELECLKCDYCYSHYDIGQVYFSSEEIAQKAISVIGEARIKKYLFGVNYNSYKKCDL